MGVGHYENFPVASLLSRRHCVRPIRAIYRFARTADDIADEGNAPPAERLAGLAELRGALDAIEPEPPANGRTLRARCATPLPITAVARLAVGLRQDVVTLALRHFESCSTTAAGPRIRSGACCCVLYGRSDPQCEAWSDAICTALQLTNFWQDVALDWSKGRIYVPAEDLSASPSVKRRSPRVL